MEDAPKLVARSIRSSNRPPKEPASVKSPKRSPSKSPSRSNSPRSPVPSPARSELLTLKSGCPIGSKLNSLLLGKTGPNLLADTVYIEEAAHFNRERIPERVVHAKGGAAGGEFVVTSAEIIKYCRASLFASKGKSTSAIARFSQVAAESGAADTSRDVRGFAVKFFTEQGNWDLVGNNLPVFFIRDPINFASLIHSQKRNPKTHLRDPDAYWDYVAENPETLHAICMVFSDRGIPDGFRHMHGYGVNTFKLVNERGQAFYAKFHWICEQPIRNLEPSMADVIAGIDPDYAIRDLQISIENGHYPSWLLKFQVMSLEEASKADFNVLDVTKTWPQAKYPLQEIGRLKLDQNADNYFAQVEQLAFSPANMVPGIEASPDKMLMGRMFAYPDAQRYRLGTNYADLPCNKPKCPVMTPTYCDGQFCTANMSGAQPNYVPSSKAISIKPEDKKFMEHSQEFHDSVGRFDLSRDQNYTQPRVLVTRVLGADGRRSLASNVAAHLVSVKAPEIVKKVMKHFNQIDSGLAKLIEEAMLKAKQAPRLLP